MTLFEDIGYEEPVDRLLVTEGGKKFVTARAVTLPARHASPPVAATLSPEGELPHIPSRGPRSQFAG
ncbi:hypothetical protein [Burkholderia catarinensis]|uniref:hypothetical protein n=1 Tax=Burkholderia catarinensis TaxID=1108140 RepID=UPI00100815C4|nr:hypothetical protein [Burkholderia catarinensis]